MFRFQPRWARDALAPHFKFLDRPSRNLRRLCEPGLRDPKNCLCDHFRERVVAIHDAERMQRLLVSLGNAGDLFRLPWHALRTRPSEITLPRGPAVYFEIEIETRQPMATTEAIASIY